MALICIQMASSRVWFDPADILEVEEPTDFTANKKPAGWPDGYAAVITLRPRPAGQQWPVTVSVGHAEWPAVKAALGLHTAVLVAAKGV